MSAVKKTIKIKVEDDEDNEAEDKKDLVAPIHTDEPAGKIKLKSKKTTKTRKSSDSKGSVSKKIKPIAKKRIKTVAKKGALGDKPRKKISIVDYEDKPLVATSLEDRRKDKGEDILLKESTVVKDIVTSSPEEVQDKEIEEAISSKVKARRSIKLYRKIALSFIFLTVALLAVVFYFSFVKVTIILIPNQERISNNMIIDIYDEERSDGLSENSIKGIVKLIKIEHTNVYPASGEEVIGEEAVGQVKIISNYIKNQPLVATTRLLTPDNKLFRISNTVNIPAGGSVEVDIYADEPSQEMAIGPTKFTIPGLWAGLQDKIYAESYEDIIYRQKVKRHIIEEDIDNSIRDLKQQLLTKAKSEINETYQDYGQIIYKIDENSIRSEVLGEAEEEVDEFTTSMESEVVVVAFDDTQAAALAKQKFISALSENKEMLSFDENNIIYSLNNYNYLEGAATINVTFEGKVSIKEDSDIIEIDKILGLNKQQLDTYLTSLPEIAGFEVKFFPSFIKKVPKLVDRVEIEIKK